MPLVGTVGRRRPRARFAIAMVYLVLVVGAITTVYPFLLMMTTGFKGPTDQNDNKIIPTYFSKMEGPLDDGKPDLGTLEWKYLNDKYVADLSQINSSRIGPTASPGEIEMYD